MSEVCRHCPATCRREAFQEQVTWRSKTFLEALPMAPCRSKVFVHVSSRALRSLLFGVLMTQKGREGKKCIALPILHQKLPGCWAYGSCADRM